MTNNPVHNANAFASTFAFLPWLQSTKKKAKELASQRTGQKDNAAKMKEIETIKKNGQLLTGVCCQWRDSASYDIDVLIETFVLRRKFNGEIATEQQPPIRWQQY